MATKEYLTKKELLLAIHACKTTYCHFLEPEHAQYHVIVPDKELITPQFVDSVIYDLAAKKKPIVVERSELIIRVMTHEHIPLDPDRKRKARNTDQSYARTPFPPFKHFMVSKDGSLYEVLRSHWRDGFENGHFASEEGRIDDRLGKMFLLLVERISRKPNWRGYSFVSEMRSNALIQLCANGLSFDESKSDNPFAYYTTVIQNAFIRTLNVEKRDRTIRDDLLEKNGYTPSMTRQLEKEFSMLDTTKPIAQKRGRKPSKITIPE
jgi:hypothetical protein